MVRRRRAALHGGLDADPADPPADQDLAADYEHVVIDTPPGEMSITRSAILAVPLVLVPFSPTGLDIPG